MEKRKKNSGKGKSILSIREAFREPERNLDKFKYDKSLNVSEGFLRTSQRGTKI